MLLLLLLLLRDIVATYVDDHCVPKKIIDKEQWNTRLSDNNLNNMTEAKLNVKN